MSLIDHANGNHPVEMLENAGSDPSAENNVRGPFPPPNHAFARRIARPRAQLAQNRLVFIAAGAVVVAMLVFVAVSMPRGAARNSSRRLTVDQSPEIAASTASPTEKTLSPIIESQKTAPQTQRDGFLNEDDLERTARGKPSPNFPRASQNATYSLSSIPPFENQEDWQAPPYQPPPSQLPVGATGDFARSDREGMQRSSLAFMRSATVRSSAELEKPPDTTEDLGLGLPIGSRLRARLETAVSSAVRTPVLAVIEYNYVRDGKIIVPAGTKAVGRLQDADRSGYVRLQFESLLMPDGASLPMRAVATDLQMKPLRGKVEGKHTGRNVLVRSLSGIGQAGSMLVGRGSLDQPLSESDMLRELISNNIGEASDEQISRMSITQHVVITIPADTPIYAVIEKGGMSNPGASQPAPPLAETGNKRELRELLQLQEELNQTSAIGK